MGSVIVVVSRGGLPVVVALALKQPNNFTVACAGPLTSLIMFTLRVFPSLVRLIVSPGCGF